MVHPVFTTAEQSTVTSKKPKFIQSSTTEHKHDVFIRLFNALQIVGSEAYINGLEIPDQALEALLDQVLDFLVPHSVLLRQEVRKLQPRLSGHSAGLGGSGRHHGRGG